MEGIDTTSSNTDTSALNADPSATSGAIDSATVGSADAGGLGEIGTSPSPTPAAPAFDYESLARANAQALAPALQQFAPKPPAPEHPWSKPEQYWDLTGFQGPAAFQEMHRRVDQLAEHKAQAAVEKMRADIVKEVQQAFQGQRSYFAAQFQQDPVFSKIQPHFDKYVQRGYDAADARFLAERDAGISRSAAPSAAGPRPVPMPPKHATSPATRNGAPAPASAKGWNVHDTGERESRFSKLAAEHGYSRD